MSAGAPLCKGTALSGPGLWKHDVREAQEYATFKLIQRDNVKVSDLTWSQHDMVEGDELQLTNTVDGSRTYAYVAMHEMKLYIAEATVPKAYPGDAVPDVDVVGRQGRQGHPLRDDVQQRIPRAAAVSGAAAQHGRRRSITESQTQLPTSNSQRPTGRWDFFDLGSWALGNVGGYLASHASGLNGAFWASRLK